MTIGQVIKNYRKDNKLSQRAFAKDIDLSFQTVNKIEKKKFYLPSAKVVKEIAKGMNISCEELLSKIDAKIEVDGERYKIVYVKDY